MTNLYGAWAFLYLFAFIEVIGKSSNRGTNVCESVWCYDPGYVGSFVLMGQLFLLIRIFEKLVERKYSKRLIKYALQYFGCIVFLNLSFLFLLLFCFGNPT